MYTFSYDHGFMVTELKTKELSLHAGDLEHHTNEVSGLRKDMVELKKQLSDKTQEVLNGEHAINVLTSGNEHLGQENAVLEKKNLGLESEIALLKQRMVEMEVMLHDVCMYVCIYVILCVRIWLILRMVDSHTS